MRRAKASRRGWGVRLLLPTLFERLVRGYRSTVLGLGLYLARGIAEAHGGTLSVDSAGSDTTFRLALPVEGARHAT